MIRKFTLLFLFSLPFLLNAQDLTGIWRGNFSQKNFNPISGNFADDTYKYEVQIIQKPDNSLDGVTYSYKKTEFYGKASLHGLMSKKSKNIIIKEIRLIEHHSNNNTSTTCLMTCYFDYVKRGKLEILTGTYTSINTDAGNSNNNCGEGTVYLEKVTQSDFDEESFLSKKKSGTIANAKSTKKEPSSTNKNVAKSNKSTDNQTNSASHKSDGTTAKKQTEKHAVAKKNNSNDVKKTIAKKSKIDSTFSASNFPNIKPGAETFVVKNKTDNQMDTFYKYKIDTTVYVYDSPSNKRVKKNNVDTSSSPNKITLSTNAFKNNPEDSNAQIPRPLIERENKLVNTIEVDEKEVRIDFYDNGEIDNDTISVYDNNKSIVNQGRLSYTPITLNLTFSNENKVHEIITVAENLGDIPPNTALMVITYGKKRYEVFITSDEKRNAKVVLEYKAKPKIK